MLVSRQLNLPKRVAQTYMYKASVYQQVGYLSIKGDGNNSCPGRVRTDLF